MEPEARFRALFREAYPGLRAYAHHRGLAGPDADDLVASVLAIAPEGAIPVAGQG